MFDRVLGIPAHPLFIHAAVVLVPLLALTAVLYAVWPASRRHIRWPLVAFALTAPGSVFFAKESGESFSGNRAFQAPQVRALIAEHEDYADTLFWVIVGLAVVALVMAFMIPAAAGGSSRIKAPAPAHWVASGLSVVLAIAAAYYVYKTGDSGAHMVWSGF
ncbi:DUF2231 domain-containing protein [Dactylosporangium sp. NPDC051485]|uniref:DUF2231 domain-containing protein n=1 Tax=Dactylosporangium sp. NPDC051485 TaxID=3154846 RepID=UPI00343B9CC1